MPGADGGGRDLVDGYSSPCLGEVVAPQRRVKSSGALSEVVAGEVVGRVLADGSTANLWRAPALTDEVRLLSCEPRPGIGLGGAEDLRAAPTIRADIPRAVAAARQPVNGS